MARIGPGEGAVFRCCVAAVLVSAALAGPAAAQPRANTPCADADILGVWELTSIRADEPGVQAFYAQHPVEYMRFRRGGDYIYVAMNSRLPGLAEINASLDRADRGDGVSYLTRFVDTGVLVIFRDGQPFQGFTCTMTDADTMVWGPFPGNASLYRRHRRVR